jgi:hypothetical protein
MDDFHVGCNRGKRLEFIATDPGYRAAMNRIRAAYPDIGAYLVRRLSTEYGPVFSNDVYTIYRRVATADMPLTTSSSQDSPKNLTETILPARLRVGGA